MRRENYKTVRVRATVEYDIEVPDFMTKEDITSHRNEGTWCADSLVEELEQQMGTGGDWTKDDYRPCMCGTVRVEVLDAPEDMPIRDPRRWFISEG